MARIVITTFGSSGDLNPFIAIGLGLRERGHDVLFAVEDIFRPPLEALGFPVARLTGDSEAALDVLLRDPSYRRNAESLAARIAGEDGVGGVCAGVEVVLNKAKRPVSSDAMLPSGDA